MRDRPILFSAPMVRAVLDGRKTQTRRLAEKNGKPSRWTTLEPETRLWVRETWQTTQFHKPVYRADACDQSGARWHSIQPGDPDGEVHWRPSIHMPRWASRLTLVVTDVRIERLQDISEDDARAEGARRFDDIPLDPFHTRYPAGAPRWSMQSPADTGECLGTARFAFANYWIKLHGDDAWLSNPEVVAITFDPIRENIERMPA